MTINVNLKIFLFAILFYFTKQIEIYALLMLFAFIHEMGHLICGLLLGLKPKALKIMPLGICIEFNVIYKDYNKKIKNGNVLSIKKMILALAGPITNIIIIALCIFYKNHIGMAKEIIYANLLIAIFNLIPIYPLDGGRFLKELIHIIKGKKESIKCINFISNACIILITMLSSIGIYYYKNIAIVLIIGYLWILTITENKKYNMKKRIYKIIENSWNKTHLIVRYTKEMWRKFKW